MIISDPPPELLRQIYPWIEKEYADFRERRQKLGRIAQDPALQFFLDLLLELRRVLLQDAAILYTRYPGTPIFQHSPLNTQLFRDFAASSIEILAAAEREAQQQLSQLPETYANMVRNTAIANQIETEKMRAEL